MRIVHGTPTVESAVDELGQLNFIQLSLSSSPSLVFKTQLSFHYLERCREG